MRRADRLPHAATGGRCSASRDLRVRRGGPHPGAGRALSGPRDLRVYPAGRYGGAAICPRARRRLGRRIDERPPEPLDAALIFAPVGALVPTALAATRKGGSVVCGGIHMSDIPAFPYALLWEERVVRSVANLTRRDAEEFWPSPRPPASRRRRRPIRSPTRTARCPICAAAPQGAAVLVRRLEPDRPAGRALSAGLIRAQPGGQPDGRLTVCIDSDLPRQIRVHAVVQPAIWIGFRMARENFPRSFYGFGRLRPRAHNVP